MHALTRLLAAGLCAAAAASAVQAQTGSLSRAPNTRTPSSNSLAAQAAPRPGGLQPVFPAGISSGSGAAVSNDPIARTTSPIAPNGGNPGTNTGNNNTGGTRPGGTGNTGGTDDASNNAGNGTGTAGNNGGDGITPPVAPVTTVLGAGSATVRGPAQDLAGAGGFSAHDQARSFFFADANKDGELTRAEAARLSISTLPFEEMDRNFDGVVTRFEYQDTLR